jgi:ribosome-binding protein aMBF1 (putative translation factor)
MSGTILSTGPVSVLGMDARETFEKNLARLRAAKGISQTQLASRLGPYKLGVTQGYVSELESGKRTPRSRRSPKRWRRDRCSQV